MDFLNTYNFKQKIMVKEVIQSSAGQFYRIVSNSIAGGASKVWINQLSRTTVFSTDEAIKVLEYGQKNRQISSNTISANSSRSHAVFCINILTMEVSIIQ